MIKDSNTILDESIYTEADASGIKGTLGGFLKNAEDGLKNVNSGLAKADETVNKAKDGIEGGLNAVKSQHYDGKSIIARARKSVLQFPIYITQTMRPNEAQIISKLFERVYTTLVQTVLAQNPIITEEEANDLLFLRNFHTNLTESGDLFVNVYYNPIDSVDEMMTESLLYENTISPTMSVKFRWIPASECGDLIKENARLLNEPLSGLSYLMEDTAESTDAKYTETQINLEVEFGDLITDILRAEGVHDNNLHDETLVRARIDAIKNALKAKADPKDPHHKDYMHYLNDTEKKVLRGNLDRYSYRDGKFYRQSKEFKVSKRATKSDKFVQTVKAPTILKDADIKKINGMLPYTIEAAFLIKGEITREVKFVIGIKSVLHPIRVQDLAEDLRELVTGRIKKLQKVRYKTGEINFMDYMFNIKGAKADAAKRINYNKKWLNTLKRLGEYEKINNSYLKLPVKLITGGNVPIPNGTLILSQADVTMLTDQTGIDLSKVSNAKKLAKSIFLIAVVIVDSAAGSMRVLFPDTDIDWDVQSLAAIDAEVSKTDNSPLLNEMRKLINK